jgi:hypothetical protein
VSATVTWDGHECAVMENAIVVRTVRSHGVRLGQTDTHEIYEGRTPDRPLAIAR